MERISHACVFEAAHEFSRAEASDAKRCPRHFRPLIRAKVIVPLKQIKYGF